MPDTVRTAHYFKVEVPDRPGEATQRLALLRQAGVNLLAFHGFPRGRRSQLDFVPADVAAFRAAAKGAGWKIGAAKRCFLVEGQDRTGALAELLGHLAAARINVTAVSGVTAGTGRYGAILWVDPKGAKKAAQVLGAGT